jgi:hypothetical protein
MAVVVVLVMTVCMIMVVSMIMAMIVVMMRNACGPGRYGCGDVFVMMAVIVVMRVIMIVAMRVIMIMIMVVRVMMTIVVVMIATVVMSAIVLVGVSRLAQRRPQGHGANHYQDEQRDSRQQHGQTQVIDKDVVQLALGPEHDADTAQGTADADGTHLVHVEGIGIVVVVRVCVQHHESPTDLRSRPTDGRYLPTP